MPGFRVTYFRHTGDFGINPPYVWTGDMYPLASDALIRVVDSRLFGP